MRLPLARSPLGTWPSIQACALTGNRTSNPLIHRLALNHSATPARAEFLCFKYFSSILHKVRFYFVIMLRYLLLIGEFVSFSFMGITTCKTDFQLIFLSFCKNTHFYNVGSMPGQFSNFYPRVVKNNRDVSEYKNFALYHCSAVSYLLPHTVPVGLELGSKLAGWSWLLRLHRRRQRSCSHVQT